MNGLKSEGWIVLDGLSVGWGGGGWSGGRGFGSGSGLLHTLIIWSGHKRCSTVKYCNKQFFSKTKLARI